jgi:hypothetical protein
MSILGKHRLGVSSPIPPSHTISEPSKPLSRDLEDLESLIRSLADELERAEDQKAMQKSDSSTGTGSPDLLATPVTASNSPISEMGDQVVTPPPVRHREHKAKSASREGKASDEKARHARVTERREVSASTGSDGKRTRSEKPRREKVDDKSSSKPVKEEKALSTRTRSRREGLDGSSDKKKVPVKRTEIQIFIRIALLCKLSRSFEWANELMSRPGTSSNNDTLYRPRTLHDPNNPHSAIQLPPTVSSPTYRLLHIPLAPRHHLLALNIPILTPRTGFCESVPWDHCVSSGFGGCRWKADGEFIGSLLWSSMGCAIKSGYLGGGCCRGWNVFCSLVLRMSHIPYTWNGANEQDHIWPIPPAKQRSSHVVNLFAVGIRSIIYLIHVFYAEKACNWAFSGPMWYLRERPEKQVSHLTFELTPILMIRSCSFRWS